MTKADEQATAHPFGCKCERCDRIRVLERKNRTQVEEFSQPVPEIMQTGIRVDEIPAFQHTPPAPADGEADIRNAHSSGLKSAIDKIVKQRSTEAALSTERRIRQWMEANPGKTPMLRYLTPADTQPVIMESDGSTEVKGDTAFFTEKRLPVHTEPDDTKPPEPRPFYHGERHRNPYYQATRDVWMLCQGEPLELMIHHEADVTDVIHAFDLSYDFGEVLAKMYRLGRKPGANIKQEFIKMHEHLQAAEDAWSDGAEPDCDGLRGEGE